MPSETSTTFRQQLEDHVGPLRRVKGRHEMYDAPEASTRFYIRYSRVHKGGEAWYGLYPDAVAELTHHPKAVLCLLNDLDAEPYLIPFAEVREPLINYGVSESGRYNLHLIYRDGRTVLQSSPSHAVDAVQFRGWSTLGLKPQPKASSPSQPPLWPDAVSATDDVDGLGDEEDVEPDDPVSFWRAKQRELLTSVVDYNLGTLAELISAKRIDVSPQYQRRFRWDEKRQSRLIESFLMNVPVPPIFLNEDQFGEYSVIDGKQRLMAVHSLLEGHLRLTGLTVFSDVNGLTFDELPQELQTVLRVRPTMRAVIVLRQSDPDIKFEVFRRLNTGGVRLNAQEIRNSTYPGPLNDLVLELSQYPAFHALLGVQEKAKSSLYLEMRDAELVLRYFTFRDNWENFSSGMMRAMDKYMADNFRASTPKLGTLRQDFLHAVENVQTAFGEHAFRRWDASRGKWKRQVLAALFDAQMFAVDRINTSVLAQRSTEIINGMRHLFEVDEFAATIDAATNTPSFFRRRVQLTREMITRVLQGQ